MIDIENEKKKLMSMYSNGEITEKEYRKFMILSGNYVISEGCLIYNYKDK